MSDFQRNIISRLLKVNGKTKRELAAYLGIHENGINRLIGNKKISMERLEQIAAFLGMTTKVLFDKIYPQPDQDVNDPSKLRDKSRSDVEEIIVLLSEVVMSQRSIKELEESNAAKLMEVMNLIINPSSSK
jgi:transcriptional regulator with XRE-family HTH domain